MAESIERDAERDYCIGSYVAALCHLLKRSGSITSEIKLFVWRILIPLLKLARSSHLEIFNEIDWPIYGDDSKPRVSYV